jgi:hypothetical protein
MSKINIQPKVFTGILVIIFFFNYVLPWGLTVNLILTPFYLFSLIRWGKIHQIFYLLLGLLAINIPHVFIAQDFIYLFVSNVVLFSTLIFLLTSWNLLKAKSIHAKHINTLVYFNIGLLVLAGILFFSDSMRSVLWYENPFTPNHKVIPRLKMFTLEASQYSLLLIPLFLYYTLFTLTKISVKNILLLCSVCISLLFSFSLGVILALVISLTVVIGLNIRSIICNPLTRKILFSSASLFSIAVIILVIYFPDNPLFFRIKNVLTGVDTSGRGRTYEAFDIAWKVLLNNNKWTGIGLGQFKTMGRETLINYYQFMNPPKVVRLPNAMAETLVSFGIIGFLSKLLIQIYLFVKLKVNQNLFQLALFTFLFIYQFTGSYLTNSAELMFWALAFSAIFPHFSASKVLKI